jgi:hypothetical protein
MLKNKYCLHLTQFQTKEYKAFFLKHVAMYKERANLFLEEKIVHSGRQVYLLLDFFVSNGPLLRRNQPHLDVIFGKRLSAFMNSVFRFALFDP